MRTHTDPSASLPPAFEGLPPVLDAPPSRPRKDDDWRLSRSAKPLRTWRLSK
ncbi:MAG: hypothetical protein ABWY06_00535 [Pseudomonas sp.]|uniref:hypothetical protein n=1 Tax=Pseudomonas sp. TaxID=306 RepID=UPI0033971C0F